MVTSKHVPHLFLILTLVQAWHSAEEIMAGLYEWLPVVTGKIHETIGLFPVIHMSGSTFVLLNILTVLFLSIICVFVFGKKRWALRVAGIAGVVEILNGLVHVSAAVYIGGYYPGAISGVGLLAVGILLVYALRH